MSVYLSDLPVPPDCPYFTECDEGPDQKKSVHFKIEGGREMVMIAENFGREEPQIIQECLCHCDEKMVPIICAVAFFEFSKKAEFWRKQSYSSAPRRKDSKDALLEERLCNDAALAWYRAIDRILK